MPDITDADLDYLRNIDTRPGANAGQSIDPTQHGPTADRIAELEREISELEAANEAATEWGAAICARLECVKELHAELARLRNEQPKGGDEPTDEEIYHAALTWQSQKATSSCEDQTPYFRENWRAFPGLEKYVRAEIAKRAPSPFSSPEPQDVRELAKRCRERLENGLANFHGNELRAQDVIAAYLAIAATDAAALAQSPPQNVRKSDALSELENVRAALRDALLRLPTHGELIEAFSPSNAPPDAQPGSGPEITWFGVKSDA